MWVWVGFELGGGSGWTGTSARVILVMREISGGFLFGVRLAALCTLAELREEKRIARAWASKDGGLS